MMLNANKLRTVVAVIVSVCLPAAVTLSACADPSASDDDDAQGEGATGPGTQDDGPGICLMNNCSSDSDCGGCDDNRTSCMVAENRCVACDPVTGGGCAEGEYCSPYGICAPDGQTCESDEHGDPLVNCSENNDCLACSPMNQVCSAGKCTSCTDTNTQHCLASDICVEGKCSPKCPSSCTADNDCGQCGSAGNEAHACNAHKCAECSDSFPCAAGLECVNGSCIPQCGIPGPQTGDCVANEDCNACGDPNQQGSYECKKPINQNGPSDHGTCGPVAAGCSDLGSSVAVLPQPWGDVTNLCSNDSDCSGVGITYNVGEAIRDLVGSDKINLGFIKVEIHDANIQYKMPICADIDITENISCGVCVPCEVDSDCQPIGIDPLIGDLFTGEPLAQIAASLLLDLLWGDNTDHNLNFFCQPVAAGYGVCTPCSNPLQACGTNQNGGSGSGTCEHSACDQGAALGVSCDSCAATVCGSDPYCCDTAWDAQCVTEATQMCGTCGANGNNNSSCGHSECTSGPKLDNQCSSCATAVCAADPYCCDTQWDSVCVNSVPTHCGQNACNGNNNGPPPNTCSHSECTSGGSLESSCSPCATAVCVQDDYCCSNTWDSICVDIAENQSACSC